MTRTNKQIKKQCQESRGFSLIELMVSLSVFAIIMVASVGTLLTMVDANAKAQALYTATTNLSFALDSITREIRMGYNYYCSDNLSDLPADNSTKNCDGTDSTPIDGNSIAFHRERDDVRMGYRLNSNDEIEQNVGSGWEAITSHDEIRITSFKLVVQNSEPYYSSMGGGDDNQPVVDMQVVGYVRNGLETDTDFNIQSHIVQRRLDLR